MPYKIRTPKKKEEADIAVIGLGERFIESIAERPQLVWGSIALVVAAGAFTFYDQSTKEENHEKAWAIESQASKLLREPAPLPQPIEEGDEDIEPEPILDEEGRKLKSIGLYGDIIQQFPNSDAAAIAVIERGNAYYRLEKFDQAKQSYEAFLENYPNKSRLRPLIQMKLAYLNLKKGDLSEARKQFGALYDLPAHPLQDEAGYELARILELEDKTDDAVKIYTTLSESALETPWSVEAKARLIPYTTKTESAEEEPEIKTKTVGEIETPVAPAAEPPAENTEPAAEPSATEE